MRAIRKTLKLSRAVQAAQFAAFALILVSCSNPERDFQKAKQINTEQAFQKFLEKYPSSPLVKEAKAQIEEIAYETARKAATVSCYETYLGRFPKAARAAKATFEMQGLDFKEVTRTNTIPGWRHFLQKYEPLTDSLQPSEFRVEAGKINELAKRELEALEFTQAGKVETIQVWEDFVRRYPASPHLKDAREKLALLTLDRVAEENTAAGFERFLRQFSETGAATQAANLLAKLEYRVCTNENDSISYQRFLTRFPMSEYASDVVHRKLLLDLYGHIIPIIPGLDKLSTDTIAFAHPSDKDSAHLTFVSDSTFTRLELTQSRNVRDGGRMRSLIWSPGAVHILMQTPRSVTSKNFNFAIKSGSSKAGGNEGYAAMIQPNALDEYTLACADCQISDDNQLSRNKIYSDPKYPLTFKVIKDRGLVYLCGHGRVEFAGGIEWELGTKDSAEDWIVRLSSSESLAREGAILALLWLGRTKDEARVLDFARTADDRLKKVAYAAIRKARERENGSCGLLTWEMLPGVKGPRVANGTGGKESMEILDWPDDISYTGSILTVAGSIFVPDGCILHFTGEDWHHAFGIWFKGRLKVTKEGLLPIEGAQVR